MAEIAKEKDTIFLERNSPRTGTLFSTSRVSPRGSNRNTMRQSPLISPLTSPRAGAAPLSSPKGPQPITGIVGDKNKQPFVIPANLNTEKNQNTGRAVRISGEDAIFSKSSRRKKTCSYSYESIDGGFEKSLQKSIEKEIKNKFDKLDELEYFNKYIFNKEDFFLYRGVLYFYLLDYDNAISVRGEIF